MTFEDVLAERGAEEFELSPDYVDRLAEAHSELVGSMEADSSKIGEMSEALAARDTEISHLKAQIADMNLRLPAETGQEENNNDEEDDNGDDSDTDVSDLFEDVED